MRAEQLDTILKRLDELFRSYSALLKMRDDDISKLTERVTTLEKALAKTVAKEQGLDVD